MPLHTNPKNTFASIDNIKFGEIAFLREQKLEKEFDKFTFGNSLSNAKFNVCLYHPTLLHGECALTAVLHTNPKNTYASINNIKIW